MLGRVVLGWEEERKWPLLPGPSRVRGCSRTGVECRSGGSLLSTLPHRAEGGSALGHEVTGCRSCLWELELIIIRDNVRPSTSSKKQRHQGRAQGPGRSATWAIRCGCLSSGAFTEPPAMPALFQKADMPQWTDLRWAVTEEVGEALTVCCTLSDILLVPLSQAGGRNGIKKKSATIEVQGSEMKCEKLFQRLVSRTRTGLLWMVGEEEAASMRTVK